MVAIHMAHPYFGSPRIRTALWAAGYPVRGVSEPIEASVSCHWLSTEARHGYYVYLGGHPFLLPVRDSGSL